MATSRPSPSDSTLHASVLRSAPSISMNRYPRYFSSSTVSTASQGKVYQRRVFIQKADQRHQVQARRGSRPVGKGRGQHFHPMWPE